MRTRVRTPADSRALTHAPHANHEHTLSHVSLVQFTAPITRATRAARAVWASTPCTRASTKTSSQTTQSEHSRALAYSSLCTSPHFYGPLPHSPPPLHPLHFSARRTSPLDYKFYGVCVSSCPAALSVVCNYDATATPWSKVRFDRSPLSCRLLRHDLNTNPPTHARPLCRTPSFLRRRPRPPSFLASTARPRPLRPLHSATARRRRRARLPLRIAGSTLSPRPTLSSGARSRCSRESASHCLFPNPPHFPLLHHLAQLHPRVHDDVDLKCNVHVPVRRHERGRHALPS